jgi:hypothetical protein
MPHWSPDNLPTGAFVGVTPLMIGGDLSTLRKTLTVVSSALLKRNALIFDKIGVIDLEASIRELGDKHLKEAIPPADLEWLSDQGVIFEAPHPHK